jgi:multidrug resistance protein, MATE family
MNTKPELTRVPAVRWDSNGQRQVDLRAVLNLAWPMFLNSALQAVLNLTDTWFVSRISTEATAAVGALFFLVMMCLFVVGGVGLGIQTLVAQAYGAGQRDQAARYTWAALWLSLATTPLCGFFASLAYPILHPFGLNPGIETQALLFWGPRLWGGPFSVALWALTGFFNGMSQPKITLVIMAVTAVGNCFFNALCINVLGLGVAGAAYGTTLAQALGVSVALWIFLGPRFDHMFQTRTHWRPHSRDFLKVIQIGIPTGLFPAVDVIGFALFQMMMSRLGAIDGAATQLVMMLTSIGYLPSIGIGMAGTTLVGQSIGAGDRDWAMKLGNRTVLIAMAYMGGLGFLFAWLGPEMLAGFIDPLDPNGPATLALACSLLWVAAGYQLFDAVNVVSAFCLRGAGDVRVPTIGLLLASWLFFLPLTHALSFAPGQGYVHFLPQLGWRAWGGWIAALTYILLLAVMLFARWRSGAWKRIQI